jgi:hypothetical protein
MEATRGLTEDAEVRLAALAERYRAAVEAGDLPVPSGEVNCHVHSRYSFSPYSPSDAAWQAWRAGLEAVGIMDHDSFAGAAEMVEACRILGIGSTCGLELRASAAGTRLAGRLINHPDSPGFLYLAFHGVPLGRSAELARFLAPIAAARGRRNRAMLAKLNAVLAAARLKPLDYERDVAALSWAAAGGSVTERHLLAALAGALIAAWGKGRGLVDGLKAAFGLEPPAAVAARLLDAANPHYLYDLLGVLKAGFLDRFYLQPDEAECPPVREIVAFALSVDAVPAYPYLGDVGESPTGDKKAEKFEDDYLELLLDEVVDLGFRAVTFMPPRNTAAQLERLMGLCAERGLMQISGVDINSSRQSFSCPQLLKPEFGHLNAATWALIAHEKLAGLDPRWGLFHPASVFAGENLDARIARYAAFGAGFDPRSPVVVAPASLAPLAPPAATTKQGAR